MDDESLWDAFTQSTLPHAEWTHVAHVRTAYLFLQRYPLDEAHLRLRAGIIRLNARHGLVESSTRGYFETLTRAWLVLVAAANQTCNAQSSEALLAAHPELLDRGLTERHYTKALLATTRARAIFVGPDVAPLPNLLIHDPMRAQLADERV
jgi:hypothetical protein